MRALPKNTQNMRFPLRIFARSHNSECVGVEKETLKYAKRENGRKWSKITRPKARIG
jgi:hypothetical protein